MVSSQRRHQNLVSNKQSDLTRHLYDLWIMGPSFTSVFLEEHDFGLDPHMAGVWRNKKQRSVELLDGAGWDGGAS